MTPQIKKKMIMGASDVTISLRLFFQKDDTFLKKCPSLAKSSLFFDVADVKNYQQYSREKVGSFCISSH
jgi:hypothetical protein